MNVAKLAGTEDRCAMTAGVEVLTEIWRHKLL